jgi:hypothetical protein
MCQETANWKYKQNYKTGYKTKWKKIAEIKFEKKRA